MRPRSEVRVRKQSLNGVVQALQFFLSFLLLQRHRSPAGSLGAREWHCGDQRQPDAQPFAIGFLSRQVLSQ